MFNRIVITLVANCLFASGLVFSTVTNAASNDAKAEREVLAAENLYAAAVVKNDQAVLSSMMADDCLVINGNGVISTKEMDLARIGKRAFSAMENDDMKVRVYGQTAIVTGKVSYKTANNSGAAIFTDVLVKNNSAWQFVSTHYSYLNPAK